jgi:iron(III) transport system substrate-binding protein
MSVIPPAFMKRFPGVTVDQIDATSDKLIARVLAEQKGGRVIADVISGALTYLPQILDLKIVEHVVIPDAAAYPAQLKGDLWVATDTQFYIAGWNTNLVKKGEEPKSYEDLANPKWKDGIMGEPRDYQVLVGFAKRKYNNDEKGDRSVQENRCQSSGVSSRAFAINRIPRGRPARHMFYLLLAPFSHAHEKRAPRSNH